MKFEVTLSQGPQWSGMVTLGATSLRSTYPGVSKGVTVSARCSAPEKAEKEKYAGRRSKKDWSTELNRTSGAVRSTIDVCGEALRKFL